LLVETSKTLMGANRERHVVGQKRYNSWHMYAVQCLDIKLYSMRATSLVGSGRVACADGACDAAL
jgi:hypothetical protein